MSSTIKVLGTPSAFSLLQSGNVITGRHEALMHNGWQMLLVKPEGDLIKIDDILINGQSISEILYTGWFEESQTGVITCPATYVDQKTGHFKLMVHSNLGVMRAHYKTVLPDGKYGTDLFDEYYVMCDSGTSVPEVVESTSVRSFFEHPYGPFYYKKGSDTAPYYVVNEEFNQDIAATEVLELLSQSSSATHYSRHKGWSVLRDHNKGPGNTDWSNVYSVNEHRDELPYVTNWLLSLGITELYGLYINKLEPGGFVEIHIDGCEAPVSPKMYIPVKVPSPGAPLKFMHGGVSNLTHPMLVNTHQFAHAACNYSNEPRYVITVYGDFTKYINNREL
jgi:hypothetical protein